MKKLLFILVSVVNIQNITAMDMPDPEPAAEAPDLSASIFQAIERNNINYITELAHRDYNFNCRGTHGRTPLHAAAIAGNTGIALLLLNHGAEGNIGDEDGNSVLHLAVINRRSMLVMELLGMNIEINLQNNAGETALHIAVQSGQSCVAQLLIREGASITVKDRAQKSPRDVARENGDVEIFRSITELAQANIDAGNIELQRFLQLEDEQWARRIAAETDERRIRAEAEADERRIKAEAAAAERRVQAQIAHIRCEARIAEEQAGATRAAAERTQQGRLAAGQALGVQAACSALAGAIRLGENIAASTLVQNWAATRIRTLLGIKKTACIIC
jgi:hypothetical protein